MMTCLTRQEEILRDCEQMIPDTTRRLKDATTELHTYMVRNFDLLRRPVLAKQLGRQTSGTKLIRPWLPFRRKAEKKVELRRLFSWHRRLRSRSSSWAHVRPRS